MKQPQAAPAVLSLAQLSPTLFNVFFHFSWEGMLIRSAIAAIDFNSNVGRGAKITPDGQPRFKKKVSLISIHATDIGSFSLPCLHKTTPRKFAFKASQTRLH